MLSQLTKQKICERIEAEITKLDGDKTPETFVRTLSCCYSSVDLIIETLKEKSEVSRIACHSGCTWCCNLPVTARAYEIVLIAEYILKYLDAVTVHALKKKIDSYIKHKDQSPNNIIYDFAWCPLLENNHCIIYFVRPINCQAHNSIDEITCQKIREGEKEIIQFDPIIGEIFETAFHSIQSSFRHMNLDTSPVKLIQGLKRAIEIPEQGEKYLKNHYLFF